MAAPETKKKFLTGWKEIASYLGKGVRTCQRYERDLSLAIHRLNGSSKAAVLATPEELANWVAAGASQESSIDKRYALDERTNKLRVDFLLVDSQIALTFCTLAMQERDESRKIRTAGTARRAYETIVRFREDTHLEGAAAHKLETNLARLRSELERLGETFSSHSKF